MAPQKYLQPSTDCAQHKLRYTLTEQEVQQWPWGDHRLALSQQSGMTPDHKWKITSLLAEKQPCTSLVLCQCWHPAKRTQQFTTGISLLSKGTIRFLSQLCILKIQHLQTALPSLQLSCCLKTHIMPETTFILTAPAYTYQESTSTAYSHLRSPEKSLNYLSLAYFSKPLWWPEQSGIAGES